MSMQQSRLLVFDGQVFQTPAWHRGMGKYSVELLSAISSVAPPEGWEALIRILLSSRIPSDKDMVSFLKRQLPNAKLEYLDLYPDEIGDKSVAVKNRQVVDEYIRKLTNEGYEEIDYTILSLMQGHISPVFPSVDGVNKILLFYDIIPLTMHDMYLRNSITRTEYLPKIGELLKADSYLAISKTVANDLTLYLGIDPSRVVSIDGGAINHAAKEKTYPIDKPFFLMPTGNDLRKNNRRAIMGFEQFNAKHHNQYQLVITSFFKDHEVEELSRLSPSVTFTGNISGEELEYLYKNATALLFPPEYEGLGMPIIEAIQKNKPIACSNIAVFREMSTTAFEYFDPYSVNEVELALERTITPSTVDKKEYAAILRRYTWENSAKKMIDHLSALPKAQPLSRRRIAVFGPSPTCNNTQVGRRLQEWHAELSRSFDIDYYLESGDANEQRVNYLSYIVKTRQLERGFRLPAETLPAIYHIGNGDDFAHTLFAALGRPGVTILHDLDLRKAWDSMLQKGLISRSRLAVEEQLQSAFNQKAFGLVSLLKTQKAVIVFSAALKSQLRASGIINEELVHLFSYPISCLVYPEALPEKTTAINNLMQSAELVQTDFQRYGVLSKTQVALLGEVVQPPDLLEVMRFGIVPILAGEENELKAAPAVYDAKDVRAAEILANKLLVGEKKLVDSEKRNGEYVSKHHAARDFPTSLYELLSGDSSGEEEIA